MVQSHVARVFVELPLFLQQRAAAMAARPTQAEAALAAAFERHASFRGRVKAQHPIGDRFIADFWIESELTIVEVDGRGHRGAYDAKRTKFLNRRGIRVVRLWNSEVLEDPDRSVLRVWIAIRGFGGGQIIDRRHTPSLPPEPKAPARVPVKMRKAKLPRAPHKYGVRPEERLADSVVVVRRKASR